MYGNVHTPALTEARFEVVALVASLGNLAALTRALSALPPGFLAPPVAVLFSARGPEGAA